MINEQTLETLWRDSDYNFTDFTKALLVGLNVAPIPSESTPTYTTGHCENRKNPKGCQLHNLQCGYPECDQKAAPIPTPSQQPREDLLDISLEQYALNSLHAACDAWSGSRNVSGFVDIAAVQLASALELRVSEAIKEMAKVAHVPPEDSIGSMTQESIDAICLAIIL